MLLLGFLYLLLSLTVLEAFRFRGEKPAAEAMREASERTAACFSAVKEERLRRGYEIPAVDDPNLTGLLGYDGTVERLMSYIKIREAALGANKA